MRFSRRIRMPFPAWLCLLLFGVTPTSGLVYQQEAKLVPADGAELERFAYSIATDGDTVLLGARMDDDQGDNSGSAYVFERSNGVWGEQAKLLPADGAAGDALGFAVALEGDTALVGAPGESSHRGAVYVFTRTDGIWTEQAKLQASDFPQSGQFGHKLAVDGDTVVIGAPSNDDKGPSSGAAYVFVRTDGTWSEQAKLLAYDGDSLDRFGYAVAVDDDTVVVGAWEDEVNGPYSGSAYVFTRTGGTWHHQAKLLASDGDAGDRFGHWSVAVDGDTAIIGADQDEGTGEGSGSAYVFERSHGVWTERAKLVPSDGVVTDYFGSAIAMAGDVALIGAYRHIEEGPGGAPGSGSVYLFTRTDGRWTERAELVAGDAAEGDRFGFAVAISRPFSACELLEKPAAVFCVPETATVAIGAWGDDDNGSGSGSAYVFWLRLESGGPSL